MQKTIIIVLLVFSISVSAKVTLTAEEREVIDSLVATYSAMVPMALLPADWPPDMEKLLDNKLLELQNEHLESVARLISHSIDETAFGALMFRPSERDPYDLPTRNNNHNLPTEVAYTRFDSGYVYLNWQQNCNEPIAHRQIEAVIRENYSARCIILDLQRFDLVEIDSVLSALSHFIDDTSITVRTVRRKVGTYQDIEIRHKLPTDQKVKWDGALLVYVWDDGWPGRMIEQVLSKRPFTSVKYDHPSEGYIQAIKYSASPLPHGYSVQVPTTAALDSNSNLLRDADCNFPQCGLDAVLLGFSRHESFYHKCSLEARPIFEKYRKERATYSQRLKWQLDDLRKLFVKQEKFVEIIVE